MLKKYAAQKGFALLALVLSLAIIGLILAAYFSSGKKEERSMRETGNEAVEKARENNLKELERARQLQKEVNLAK